MPRPASANPRGFFTKLSARTTALILLQIVVLMMAIELLGRSGTAWKAAGVGAATLYGVLNLLVLRSSQRDVRN